MTETGRSPSDDIKLLDIVESRASAAGVASLPPPPLSLSLFSCPDVVRLMREKRRVAEEEEEEEAVAKSSGGGGGKRGRKGLKPPPREIKSPPPLLLV